MRRLPAALASVAIATAVAAVAAPGIARVDLPSWRSHALPELPQGPVLALATAVFTVLLVASLESMLAAVAVDKLTADRAGGRTADSTTPAPAAPPVQRSDLDRELRGQGIANVLSGLLGGLPVSGGAVRSSANVRAGATGRAATVLHGVWVLLAAGLLVTALEWIPLAALAALVMVVGFQMVSFAHIRNVHRHREFLVYGATITGVVLFGVLEGVAIGIAVAVAVALHRLARTRITVTDQNGQHLVVVRGQLTFLAVPRLSRALGQLPRGGDAVVELDGFFMDHAAYEAIQHWSDAQTAQGGRVVFTGRSGGRIAEPASAAHSCCRPWTPWRNHHCHDQPDQPGRPVDARRAAATWVAFPSGEHPTAGQGPTGSGRAEADTPGADAAATAGPTGGFDTPGDGAAVPRRTGAHRLASGLSSFQRNTAPLVRDELARLAREGQRPSQLFITCADSRLVTSMITASGPGDLFTVRNVGNLVPPPGAEAGDDSVGAAIEYAVDVLKVESITVCGHSGCGAMQALMSTGPDTPQTSLWRWLRHGLPSLERMRSRHHAWARISGRLPADEVEQLCLSNVVQQLDHLRAHGSVARRLAEGALQLHGMYFHVGEAQAYLLAEGASAGSGIDEVFDRVGPGDPNHARPYDITDLSDPTGLSDPGDRAAVSAPAAAAGPADPSGSGELERTSA